MNDTESKQLLLEIINQAKEGDQREFQIIRSWAEFRFRRQQARSTKIVIKALAASASLLLIEYCEDVRAGTQDVNKILAYSELRDIIAFYEADLLTLRQMLDEYDEYLGDWSNFFDAIFGGERVI